MPSLWSNEAATAISASAASGKIVIWSKHAHNRSRNPSRSKLKKPQHQQHQKNKIIIAWRHTRYNIYSSNFKNYTHPQNLRGKYALYRIQVTKLKKLELQPQSITSVLWLRRSGAEAYDWPGTNAVLGQTFWSSSSNRSKSSRSSTYCSSSTEQQQTTVAFYSEGAERRWVRQAVMGVLRWRDSPGSRISGSIGNSSGNSNNNHHHSSNSNSSSGNNNAHQQQHNNNHINNNMNNNNNREVCVGI